MRDKRYKLTLSDIWYYYKVHFFVALAIIIAIVYTIYSTVTKVEPDFTIDCFSDTGITYEMSDKLEELISNSGTVDDIDGDGIVFTSISAFPTGLSSPNGDPNYIQVIQLRMAVGESAIIMAEPRVFDMYDESGVFMDITHIADECNIPVEDRLIYDGKVLGIRADNSPLFRNNGFISTDLFISLRTPTMDISKKEELMKSFGYAEDVVKYILSE
jgi:hypothetical protein